MRSRVWRLRLQDILEAITRIGSYTRDMTFEEFSHDQKTVDAVVRNLEVLGEAARHIPEDVMMAYPHIPWAEMRGIRNILIHEYFGVSLPIIWQTTNHDLPPLIPQLQRVLDDVDRDGDSPATSA